MLVKQLVNARQLRALRELHADFVEKLLLVFVR